MRPINGYLIKLTKKMAKQGSRIDFLAQKWKRGEITGEEMREFEQWYNSFNDSKKEIDSCTSKDELKHKIYAAIKTRIASDELTENSTAKRRSKKWMAAAASLIAVLSVIGGYLYYQGLSRPAPMASFINDANQYDVLPGGNKAVLLLEDGRRVVLGHGDSVLLSHANGNQVSSDGQKLIFDIKSQENIPSGTIAYNTIVTPSSGQFQVILPDGSHVWLNAESSLKFPSQFGDRRQVTLTGEGYFEVVENRSKPFEVVADGQTIQVLGTHFNVNAYADETDVKTVLLEGQVRLIAGNNSVLMKPGQESIVPRNPATANEIILRESDGQQTIAWKSGLFDFRDADIGAIMRNISRWYNVEVAYRQADSRKFSGRIYRNVSLQEVLTILNYSGINTVLEKSEWPDKNGKITVL